MQIWFLEGYLGGGQALRRIRVNEFPFRVGRQDDLSLTLDSPGISRIHAELALEDDQLVVRDLESTNGCYVNRERVEGSQPIGNGDIIHFADEEFRLLAIDKVTGSGNRLTLQGIEELPDKMPKGAGQLQQLLIARRVRPVYQPIVYAADETPHAFEMLGRGTHPELSDSPGPLFVIAESMNLAVELSELMREEGVRQAHEAKPDGIYFTNIHPNEMLDTGRLLNGLSTQLEQYSGLNLVLEVHESAVADRDVLLSLRDFMHEHDALIAYDDFGRGQARLLELAEVPPDYVKLDMSLVRDIDQAATAKQQMVQMLVRFAHDNDIRVVAEGINSDGEVAFCADLEVELLQGYRFGRPGDLPA